MAGEDVDIVGETGGRPPLPRNSATAAAVASFSMMTGRPQQPQLLRQSAVDSTRIPARRANRMFELSHLQRRHGDADTQAAESGTSARKRCTMSPMAPIVSLGSSSDADAISRPNSRPAEVAYDAEEAVAINMNAKATSASARCGVPFAERHALLLNVSSHHKRPIDQVLADIGHCLRLQTVTSTKLRRPDTVTRPDQVENEGAGCTGPNRCGCYPSGSCGVLDIYSIRWNLSGADFIQASLRIEIKQCTS